MLPCACTCALADTVVVAVAALLASHKPNRRTADYAHSTAVTAVFPKGVVNVFSRSDAAVVTLTCLLLVLGRLAGTGAATVSPIGVAHVSLLNGRVSLFNGRLAGTLDHAAQPACSWSCFSYATVASAEKMGKPFWPTQPRKGARAASQRARGPRRRVSSA